MRVKDVRYQNVRAILPSVGGVSGLAKLLGKSDNRVSSFAGVVKATGKSRKGIGDEVAAEIEAALGKPEGWLDYPHDDKTEWEIIILHEMKDFKDLQYKEVLAQIDIIKRRDRGDL